MSFFRRSSTSTAARRASSGGGDDGAATLVPVEHNGMTYLVDKINGIAYTNEPSAPQEVGTFSGGTGIMLSAEVASVVRITYNDTTYLVDKSNGVVYSNNPEDPQELGTWSADDGVVLGGGGGGGGQAKPGYQDVAPKAGYQDVKGFLNPNIELETDVKAIKAKVVYDDVPLSQKKAGYEAMNPEWLDGQHKMLSIHPWFREKSLCDARDAVKELENGVPGQFLVRVVQGAEMGSIPSAYHAGKPGNYAISVYMPREGMTGAKVVQHLLVLPSWDPTGKAAGETLYRIGTKTKRLFTSVPELVKYYCAKAFHKAGKGKNKMKFRLVNIYPEVQEGYQDVAASNYKLVSPAMIEFAESPISMPGYLDVQGNPTTGAYQDLQGGKEAAYQDVKGGGGGEGGGAGYQDVAPAGSSGVGYVAVSPNTGIGGEPAPVGSDAEEEEGSDDEGESDDDEEEDESDVEEC